MQIVVKKTLAKGILHDMVPFLKSQNLRHTELSERDELNPWFVGFFFGKALIISSPKVVIHVLFKSECYATKAVQYNDECMNEYNE